MSLASSSPGEGSTSIGKQNASFQWIINNATIILRSFCSLKSPAFYVSLPHTCYNANFFWHLEIKCQYTTPSVIISYGKHMTTDKIMLCNLRLSILNFKNQEIIYSKVLVNEDKYFEVELCAEYNKKVLRDVDMTDHLCNDTLCIQVTATLLFFENTDVPPYCIYRDICSLYKNEVLTDTIIKCEDKEFKVHRAVLASQSPVFRAMFEDDMKEKQSGVIEVSGITPAVMSDLVAYLYTGTAPNLKTLASCELMDVAEMYQLPRLLTLCKSELNSKMKETSVIEILILADQHGRASQKKACLEFIRLNSAEVFRTREWATFKNHKTLLYLELLEHLNVTCCSPL